MIGRTKRVFSGGVVAVVRPRAVTGRRAAHRGAAVVATVLAASTAGAATPGAKPGDGELETVTVYARRITPVARVAATVTVVDAARIETTLATDLRELVRYEPGLTVRSDPFRFGLDTVSIRGLGGNRVAVEIDGVPAAGGFAVGSYADSGRAFLDTAFVERVEFLRGPASSLYGSEAIGGVLAMTTLTPGALLGTREGHATQHAIRTQAGVDSEDGGWHGALVATGAGESSAWVAGYAHRRGGAIDTAAEVEPNPRRYTSDAVLLKYVREQFAGGPLTLTLEGGHVEQHTSVDAFLGIGRFASTTLLEGEDRLRRHRFSVDHTLGHGLGAAFDSATWRLYWQATATDQDSHERRSATPPRTPAVALDRAFDYDESALGFEFTAVRSLGGAWLAHELVYGLEATRTRLAERRDARQTTLETGETTATVLGETFPLRDMPKTDLTEVGVFVQDEIGPRDGRWTVVPALRVDRYELDPEVDAIYRDDNPSSTAVAVRETSFAPKLGATFQVAEGVTAFAQYARGFRSPPPEDVNIGLEVPLFRVRAVPNPALRPETSDGYELGLRFTTRALRLTTSVFQTDYDDFIESKVNLGQDATGVTLFQSQNVARARIEGVEFSSLADLGTWSPALEGWSTRLAASWTRGRDLERDQPLNSVDPPRAVVGLRYDARSQRFGTELLVTAVAAQRDVDRTRADLYRTDGHATLDLLADWRLSTRMRLNVGVFNLADARRIEWADVRGRTRDDVLVPYYTLPGINASATLHYEF